jgi:hypothetical protein
MKPCRGGAGVVTPFDLPLRCSSAGGLLPRLCFGRRQRPRPPTDTGWLSPTIHKCVRAGRRRSLLCRRPPGARSERMSENNLPDRPRSTRARRRCQRTRRVAHQIIVVSGGRLDDPAYRLPAQSLARISILAGDAFDLLREKGLLNEAGELRSSVDTFQRLVGMQVKLCRELGLTPAALGKLNKGPKPIDLAAAMADAEPVDAEQ